MNNYKIKVNNEAESREAQELFFELGCKFSLSDEDKLIRTSEFFNFPYFLGAFENGQMCFMDGKSEHQELTLPQLRDLVVLHRNDVKDANFKLFISPSQGYLSLYKASDDVFYVYADKSKCWDKSRSVSIKTKDLEPIHVSKEDEQGLISGADALRALADGDQVQWMTGDVFQDVTDEWQIREFSHPSFKFRLKPRTITLNGIEVPAPFEPKEKDIFWTLSTNYKCGYVQILCYRNDEQGERLAQFGAWRTEDEIKLVVAALRGGIKG